MIYTISTYCSMHSIDESFVYQLSKEGLISIHEDGGIEEDELHKLEIFTRWHSQLGIHPESMEVINNLLEKIRQMREEMNDLKMRLGIPDDGTNF